MSFSHHDVISDIGKFVVSSENFLWFYQNGFFRVIVVTIWLQWRIQNF